jgi:tRNA pseudouridine55 synthase
MINGVLILDKPSGCTSHDVVTRARLALQESYVGHLGTLDPLATGVLPLVVGNAARLAEYVPAAKIYEASCLLDRFTDSDDVSGKDQEIPSFQPPPPETIHAACLSLADIQSQVPPMLSAVKVDGERLYESARKGKTVERKPRPVVIRSVEVLSVEWPRVVFRVECSGGTYVRNLCRTLGERLGTGGCMENLRRLKAGPFALSEALTWDKFEKALQSGRSPVQPALRLVDHFARLDLTEKQAEDILHGRALEAPAGFREGFVVLLNPAGKIAAIAESEEGFLKPRKVFGAEGI